MEVPDEDGGRIVVGFNSLILMRSWFERYEEYTREIEAANAITDNTRRARALLAAEESFDLWMDMYPETEVSPEYLAIQRGHDQRMDQVGLNPKNPE